MGPVEFIPWRIGTSTNCRSTQRFGMRVRRKIVDQNMIGLRRKRMGLRFMHCETREDEVGTPVKARLVKV